MIYNRYIPGSNGVYRRQSVSVPDNPPPQSAPADLESKKTFTHHAPTPMSGVDLGDILLLCIVILLILESDGDDTWSILAAIAAFFFIQ